MATDADAQDFTTALNNALIDTSQFERLLAHPEFRDRVMRICRRIASHDDIEDLFHEVCLKILIRAESDLPPVKTEHQFFGWVAELAGKVHLDQKRRRVKTMSCTERAKHWPRSSVEVPEHLIDAYMDHVEKCAYHAELMVLEQKEDEQKLRAIFRLARGLDSQGRLLRGELLKAAIADHEQRFASWKKEGQITNHAFNHIALYNGGREIASCGRFFDFSRHESINDLDPNAGLQVRGISSVEDKDVLLGFYALAGVRHDGDEQLLDLDNGYTVGLKVARLTERTFAVYFRCIETETLRDLSADREYTRNDDHIPGWLGDVGILPKASAVNSRQSDLHPPCCLLLKFAAGLKRLGLTLISYNVPARRKLCGGLNSLVKALPKPSQAIQLGGIVLITGLLLEINFDSAQQKTIPPLTQQIAVSPIEGLLNRMQYPQGKDESSASTPRDAEPLAPVSKRITAVQPPTQAVNSNHKNERDVRITKNDSPVKLTSYTSRVRMAKLSQQRNMSFLRTRMVSTPRSVNAKKLSGNCGTKDQK